MNESYMRQLVIKALSGLDAISVENPARPGTPDVNFIDGWVELKVLEYWPARASTKVRVPCFTPQQRVWLNRRHSRGGSVFFLIAIAQDWLLFTGASAARNIGQLNKVEMIKESILHTSGIDPAALYKILRGGRA